NNSRKIRFLSSCFSKLDLSRIDQSKLKFQLNKNEQSKKESEDIIQTSNESKSWFSRWFSSTPTPVPSSPSLPPPSSPTSNEPITRETLLVQKLIETFILSNEAKKYIIADQFETGLGLWHMIAWCVVGTSFFLPFTL
ncbi:unnamed protein product, partial [Rotaria sordida]